jgi:hypothetical protein
LLPNPSARQNVIVSRFVLSVGLAAAVAAAGSAAVRGGGSSDEAAAPSLRPVSLSPLKLRGSRFEVKERVVVTLSVGRATRRERATAGADGTFTVDFGLVAIDPCPGRWLVAVAAGSKGTRATYKRACRPAHRQPGIVVGSA